jgi:hypothetical protein
MPWGGEGRDPLASRQVGGGDGHGPAEAIADQRRGLADLAQQRHQQLLDMAGDVYPGALGG